MKNNTISGGQLSTTELDSFILRNAEELAFLPSEWEADTLAEVLALPRVVVTRPPDEDLFAIGMRPNDCHSNCAAQVAKDTERRSRHVWGGSVATICFRVSATETPVTVAGDAVFKGRHFDRSVILRWLGLFERRFRPDKWSVCRD
jgi:hypothetical protein